jgi:hypothetical protein
VRVGDEVGKRSCYSFGAPELECEVMNEQGHGRRLGSMPRSL